MNLIAKEYIASRTEKSGVLILSEMAGAARELGEAIVINPNNREEIANALIEALDMPAIEQRRRIEIMQDRLRRLDLSHWARDFLTELISVKPARESIFAKLLGEPETRSIIERYRRARQRLILLDFDGTLVPLVDDPRDAKPAHLLLDMLARLAADPANEIVLVSGRDRTTMHNWFAGLAVGLAAEHGAWIKKPAGEWRLPKPLNADWKAKLKPMVESYADRLPGAFVEEKEFSLVWHYRRADPEQAMMVARELTDDLLNFTGNIDVQIAQGNKIVEVRNSSVGKASAADIWLRNGEFDFILAIGDDQDDEEMFAALPAEACSIRVGIERTAARFNLREPREVIKLLEGLMATELAPRVAANHSGGSL
jgi:trehalose 6-phosphate synthase/phosphatase